MVWISFESHRMLHPYGDFNEALKNVAWYCRSRLLFAYIDHYWKSYPWYHSFRRLLGRSMHSTSIDITVDVDRSLVSRFSFGLCGSGVTWWGPGNNRPSYLDYESLSPPTTQHKLVQTCCNETQHCLLDHSVTERDTSQGEPARIDTMPSWCVRLADLFKSIDEWSKMWTADIRLLGVPPESRFYDADMKLQWSKAILACVHATRLARVVRKQAPLEHVATLLWPLSSLSSPSSPDSNTLITYVPLGGSSNLGVHLQRVANVSSVVLQVTRLISVLERIVMEYFDNGPYLCHVHKAECCRGAYRPL